MDEKRYQIGDVAEMMGMSRDTLRHYEKCGILSPMKGENGYRYYSNKEIHQLIGVLFQRKMNFGLSDIQGIWSGANTIEGVNRLLDERIEEEKKAILLHHQTIARLQLSRDDNLEIQNHLGQIQLTEERPVYIIAPQATMEEGANLWFTYSQKYPGLDMMYLYDEYTWQRKNRRLEIEYKNSQLILHRELLEYVDYPVCESALRQNTPGLCVSVVCASRTRTPEPEILEQMLDWADSQGLMVSQRFYSTFLTQGNFEGGVNWFLRVWFPVF